MPRTGLPLIDIARLDAGAAEQALVAGEIRRACAGPGFFYLTGHAVTAARAAALFAEARRFFDLPEAAKDECALRFSSCNRGYEALASQTLEAGTPADLKEGFLLGAELGPDDPRVKAGWFNHGPNQWPRGLPNFRPLMMAYLAEMTALARKLMTGIALSLELPPEHFEALGAEPLVVMRLLHYPPRPAVTAPDQKGCGTHTDWGCLTLLLQDEAGGLQIETPDGWLDAPPLPGTLVVNIGDMLARWTNDRYRSTPHRVINPAGRDRLSIPLFFEGNPTHPVTCLDTCTGPDDPPRYAPTTVVEHLAEMYRRTYHG